MNKSETIEKLAAALAKAQPSIRHATKENENLAYKTNGKASRYADLTSYIDASRDALSTNGLSIVQIPSADGAKVTVTTVLMHDCGQWISGELTMTAAVATPQGIGGAITYARRYALAAMLNMGADDDDGNLASGESAEHRGEPSHQNESGAQRAITKAPGPAPTQTTMQTQPQAPKDTPPAAGETGPRAATKMVCEPIFYELQKLAADDFAGALWKAAHTWDHRLQLLGEAVAACKRILDVLGAKVGAAKIAFILDKNAGAGQALAALIALQKCANGEVTGSQPQLANVAEGDGTEMF